MKLLHGIARKLSIPLVVLSACGWVLFVVGFSAFNLRDNYYNTIRVGGIEGLLNKTLVGSSASGDYTNLQPLPLSLSSLSLAAHRAEVDWFPYWCFLITAPFLYVATFLHLLIGRWYTGIFTHFLTSLYLVCGGSVIYVNALDLFSSSVSLGQVYGRLTDEGWLVDEFWGLFPLLEWVGCAFSVLFLTFHMMLWPTFAYVGCSREEEREKGSDEEDPLAFTAEKKEASLEEVVEQPSPAGGEEQPPPHEYEMVEQPPPAGREEQPPPGGEEQPPPEGKEQPPPTEGEELKSTVE